MHVDVGFALAKKQKRTRRTLLTEWQHIQQFDRVAGKTVCHTMGHYALFATHTHTQKMLRWENWQPKKKGVDDAEDKAAKTAAVAMHAIKREQAVKVHHGKAVPLLQKNTVNLHAIQVYSISFSRASDYSNLQQFSQCGEVESLQTCRPFDEPGRPGL